MKIVINSDHGGFGLSTAAVVRYHEIIGRPIWVMREETWNLTKYSYVAPEERIDVEQTKPVMMPDNWHRMSDDEKDHWNKTYREQTFIDYDLKRDDPVLIQVVEELGELANGRHAELKIVEIPDDVKWQIEEYDGLEWVAEQHRTWS